MKSFKSPIKYFGGKGNMFKNIIKYFPKKESYDTYIEPFSGSYSIGLHMPYIPKIEIYNDLNHNVFALFYVLQDNKLFEEFKRKCDLALYNEDFRKHCIESLKREFSYGDEDMVQRAFEFFYVNRTSHNGVGGFSVNTSIRRNMSKSVSDMLSTIDNLTELHERLSHTIVKSTDGVKLIGKFNNDNVFMYCDPPYHHSTRSAARYDVDMSNDEQEKFIDACISSKAKLLISGYACDAYKRLEDNGFKRIDFVVNTLDNKNSPKEKTESLWFNYNDFEE